MWHWPQVVGRRARATELVWREWQSVQLPMVPSSLGLPTAWHCSQPDVMAGPPFRTTKRIWRAFGAAGLELLAERHLLGAQALLAVDRGPAGSRVAAAQKLLIDAFVARAAVAGGQIGADHEAVVVLLLLAIRRLVAVQAVDALPGVDAHLVFVDDGVLQAGVTLGAFARGRTKSAVG